MRTDMSTSSSRSRPLARLAHCARIPLAFLVAAVCFVPLAARAIPVAGIDFDWDASNPGASPSTAWASDIGSSNWNVNAATLVSGPGVSSLPGITAAYRFDASNGGMSAGSFSNLLGGATTRTSSSFELWFRPDSLLGGRQVIFETGGTTDGMSITLNDAQLLLRAKDAAVSVSVTRSLTAGDLSDFVQVVAVIELNSQVSLYLNGALVGQSAAVGLGDWSGTNGAGLGAVNSAVGGNTGGDLNGFDEFAGQIALMRVYGDQVLSAADVAQNFQFVANPEPSSGLLVGVGLALFAVARRR